MNYRVNLLPWREKKRAEHRRRFVGVVALGTIMAVGVQWMAGFYIENQQDIQQDRLDYLDSYITKKDNLIREMKIAEEEHSVIMKRLEVVEKLQTNRNKTTELMNLLPAMIPEGVYVDKVQMRDMELEVSGISDSMSRLATMLDRLERSASLNDVEMRSIVHGKQRFGKAFQKFEVAFFFKPTPKDEIAEVEGDDNG